MCGHGCYYNYPKDGKVNNFQCCMWVNEFCRKFNYSIVVSSTWRKDGLDVVRSCLHNGGISEDTPIIGATPVLDSQRGDEISAWLKDHPEVTNYLIFDDDSDMGIHIDRLVKCRSDAGFLQDDFNRACMLHSAFEEVMV